jgi:hypothetical protein
MGEDARVPQEVHVQCIEGTQQPLAVKDVFLVLLHV